MVQFALFDVFHRPSVKDIKARSPVQELRREEPGVGRGVRLNATISSLGAFSQDKHLADTTHNLRKQEQLRGSIPQAKGNATATHLEADSTNNASEIRHREALPRKDWTRTDLKDVVVKVVDRPGQEPASHVSSKTAVVFKTRALDACRLKRFASMARLGEALPIDVWVLTDESLHGDVAQRFSEIASHNPRVFAGTTPSLDLARYPEFPGSGGKMRKWSFALWLNESRYDFAWCLEDDVVFDKP
jgi:hypothetical protein